MNISTLTQPLLVSDLGGISKPPTNCYDCVGEMAGAKKMLWPLTLLFPSHNHMNLEYLHADGMNTCYYPYIVPNCTKLCLAIVDHNPTSPSTNPG